jgi:hypothetical protein
MPGKVSDGASPLPRPSPAGTGEDPDDLRPSNTGADRTPVCNIRATTLATSSSRDHPWCRDHLRGDDRVGAIDANPPVRHDSAAQEIGLSDHPDDPPIPLQLTERHRLRANPDLVASHAEFPRARASRRVASTHDSPTTASPPPATRAALDLPDHWRKTLPPTRRGAGSTPPEDIEEVLQ